MYRERIVYRDREPSRDAYGYDDRQPVTSDDNQRLIGQAIGAIAGAALGNQVGKGNGRVAATAVGAVLGAAIGGKVAR